MKLDRARHFDTLLDPKSLFFLISKFLELRLEDLLMAESSGTISVYDHSSLNVFQDHSQGSRFKESLFWHLQSILAETWEGI